MKVLLIVLIAMSSGHTGTGLDLEIVEIESMSACEAVAETIESFGTSYRARCVEVPKDR